MAGGEGKEGGGLTRVVPVDPLDFSLFLGEEGGGGGDEEEEGSFETLTPLTCFGGRGRGFDPELAGALGALGVEDVEEEGAAGDRPRFAGGGGGGRGGGGRAVDVAAEDDPAIGNEAGGGGRVVLPSFPAEAVTSTVFCPGFVGKVTAIPVSSFAVDEEEERGGGGAAGRDGVGELEEEPDSGLDGGKSPSPGVVGVDEGGALDPSAFAFGAFFNSSVPLFDFFMVFSGLLASPPPVEGRKGREDRPTLGGEGGEGRSFLASLPSSTS